MQRRARAEERGRRGRRARVEHVRGDAVVRLRNRAARATAALFVGRDRLQMERNNVHYAVPSDKQVFPSVL